MELPNRDALERDFASRLTRLSARHRRELTDLVGTPPDAANVPPEFWQRVEREVDEELAGVLLLIFIASSEFHGADDETAATWGDTWSQQRAGLVSREYATYSREMLDAAGASWQLKPPTRGELSGDLTSIFGPDRASKIAVNETTLTQTIGGNFAVEATVGLSAEDTWFTRNDDRVCPFCSPLHATPRLVWTREAPDGPPLHVNCRCWLVYANIEAMVEA